MNVTKANGTLQAFDKKKLYKRIDALCFDLDRKYVDVANIVDTVAQGCVDKISTEKLDELVAQTAAYAVTKHPHYGLLGGRLSVSALHKHTAGDIRTVFDQLYHHICKWNHKPAPLVSERVKQVVDEHHEELQAMIDYKYDFNYEFFGYKTLERSYLLRCEVTGPDGKSKLVIVERPQTMLLRVAIGIHFGDMEKVRETYVMLAQGLFTHATPTLFNAGTPKPQMSSCFLVAMKEDSIEGIYETLKECAQISKGAGGIGIHVHCIRCAGSYIGGTNGCSNGLVPMLRVFNNTARYVDQGGGKRKGAFAVYLEPWHADIQDYLQLKRNTGKDDMRARDLFYGLWIPDLFMKRVEASGQWSLFDPNTAPGLADCWGEAFEELYTRYEKEGRAVRVIPAHELWFNILESQIETGTPYMLYKDACNSKSNQQNLGTIKCSNLCTEVVEYSAPDETAVCNLASIALPRFVRTDTVPPTYDFEELRRVAKVATRNLNRVIDENYYPVEESRRSNMRHRPIGLGVQGLADAFILMRYPFSSDAAKQLNEDIFETIYYAACEASCELAAVEGPYETFSGSPASQGKLQFDLWGQPTSSRWDWDGLKAKIAAHGLRNSLLIAPMPTASTSQILGNNECFEPFTSNIYVRRVLSGEFPVVNKYLVLDLIQRGLWNEDIRNLIIAHNGSIQKIESIPADLRELYKIVWEIRQKDIIDMAAQRGKYIDQSQSLNLFLEAPKSSQLTSMHFYAWKQGLKTGMYYLRSRPAVDAIKFTVDATKVKAHDAKPINNENGGKVIGSSKVASGHANEVTECLSCGS